MKNLAIIYTALEEEIISPLNIIKSIYRSDNINRGSVSLILVVQTDSKKLFDFPEYPDLYILIVPREGISKARNRGLFLARTLAKQIIFADSRTCFSDSFFEVAARYRDSDIPLWIGAVEWQAVDGAQRIKSPKASYIHPVDLAYQGFGWRCVFRTSALDECTFNENIGPGTKSVIQSGEDCIFLIDFLSRNPNKNVPFERYAVISQLPRTNIESKKNRYALGSGFRVAYLLNSSLGRNFRMKSLFRLVSFLTKTFALLPSPSHRRMALDRLRGLLLMKRFDQHRELG